MFREFGHVFDRSGTLKCSTGEMRPGDLRCAERIGPLIESEVPRHCAVDAVLFVGSRAYGRVQAARSSPIDPTRIEVLLRLPGDTVTRCGEDRSDCMRLSWRCLVHRRQ